MQLSRKDSMFVLVGVGAVAIGIAAMTLPRLASSPAPVEAPPVAPPTEMAGTVVMVAREDVPRGAALTAEMLRPMRIANFSAGNAIVRPEDAVGRTAVDRIPAGQIVMQDMMTADRAGAGLAPLIPAGQRAVTVRVQDDSGLGSFLRAGDLVDLLLVLKDEDIPKPEGKQRETLGDESEARLLFNAMTILAVGDTLQEPPASEKKQERARILTVAATPDQTVRMALTRHLGVYSFTLRNPADKATEETTTVRLSELRGEPPAKPAVLTRPAPVRAPVARVAAAPAPGIEIIRGPIGAGKGGS